MADEQSDLSSVMVSRANMYSMLSRVFLKEVDKDFLTELKGMHFPQNTDNARIDDAYLRLYNYLARTPESVLDDLAVDYARAFIGSGSLDAHAAYPQESVYTSSIGLTMQESRDEVLAIFRAHGLDKTADWREGEDHLALELLFLSTTSQSIAEALDAGNNEEAESLVKTQRNFLDDHILNWVGLFDDDVPKYTNLDFYRAFADLTLAYAQEDRELLAELLEESDE